MLEKKIVLPTLLTSEVSDSVPLFSGSSFLICQVEGDATLYISFSANLIGIF